MEFAEKCGIRINVLQNYGKEEADKILYDIAVIEAMSPSGEKTKVKEDIEAVRHTIQILNSSGSGVFYGHCATGILSDDPETLKVFIYSSDRNDCIQRLRKSGDITKKEAEGLIRRKDYERECCYKLFSSRDWKDCCNYDLMLNTSKVSVEHCVRILVQEMKNSVKK